VAEDQTGPEPVAVLLGRVDDKNDLLFHSPEE